MIVINTNAIKNTVETSAPPIGFIIDLLVYLTIMFLIREVYFEAFNFIANGLFWSFTTLMFATWRIKARGLSWKALGLAFPQNLSVTFGATVAIIVFAMVSIILFQMVSDAFDLNLSPDTSNETAQSKFGPLDNNWILFFSIIPFIWIESMLEEMLDRGFLINWIEKALSSTLFATCFAVIVQALIFGFRHSYDISERSITVGLIGLSMGIGYVLFGRNLWALIFAHIALNTLSMLDRVV